MKNDIRNIFVDDMANSIENVVNCIDKLDPSPESIVDLIEDLDELTRVKMHITCSNKELANRIDKANELIKLKRIEEFKKTVANGTHEEFLTNMPWTDKTSLLIDMELYRTGSPSERPLTEEEKIYSDIIHSSIDKDIEKIALSQGFNSVDEWKKNNAIQRKQIKSQIKMYRRKR